MAGNLEQLPVSYSFTITAPDKELASRAVLQEWDKVEANQSCHARDRAAVLAAAKGMLGVLVDDGTQDVVVAMSGSLTGRWTGTDVTTVTGAGMSINVYCKQRT